MPDADPDEEPVDWREPCLVVSRETGVVVQTTGGNLLHARYFAGMVLFEGKNTHLSFGQVGSMFLKERFKLYGGTVTIQNRAKLNPGDQPPFSTRPTHEHTADPGS